MGGASPAAAINVNVVSYMSVSYLDASPARPPAPASLVVSLPRPSQPIIWSLNDKCLRQTADRGDRPPHYITYMQYALLSLRSMEKGVFNKNWKKLSESVVQTCNTFDK